MLWNPAVLKITGYTDEEYAAITPLDLFDGDDAIRVEKTIDEAFVSGSGSISATLKCKNGSRIPMRFTTTRVIYMAEPCLYGVGMDLSEDKSQINAIEESERRFRSLVQEGSDLIAVLDANAKVTFNRLPSIHFSRTPLLVIFQNLIGNALKYHNDDSPAIISITCEEKAEEFVFGVHDNGIGIDPAFHDKIFVIFQRLHTQDAFSGTGMGLAIVKKSVEHAGGRIWVESELGKGSSFYFTLPAKAVH